MLTDAATGAAAAVCPSIRLLYNAQKSMRVGQRVKCPAWQMRVPTHAKWSWQSQLKKCDPFSRVFSRYLTMKKLWSLFQPGIVWTSGAALLAIVAVPAIVHGASLHAWLFDVGQNMGADGAVGSLGSAGACAAGDPGDDGGSTDNLLDQLRKGIWPYGNPSDASNGPQLRANPGMIGAPIQSPSEGPPPVLFQGFSGDTGDKIGQAVDLLDALKIALAGGESEGTAAPPEAAE